MFAIELMNFLFCECSFTMFSAGNCHAAKISKAQLLMTNHDKNIYHYQHKPHQLKEKKSFFREGFLIISTCINAAWDSVPHLADIHAAPEPQSLPKPAHIPLHVP